MGKKISLLEKAADEARKALLYRELSAMNGQVGRVAQRLQTNRTYVYQLMKRFGIKIERQVKRTIRTDGSFAQYGDEEKR